ncbi:tumor protein p53-inducible protein 13 [Hyla sarda]|uniref:tumor protein p53-inducible protein 13 n=1 Tax=Hyla sarda TaxID=327740 RepID=UPI0024C41602|nr:tumor protein p53-inducible protein 13 [Hyla sarda]
MWGLCAVLALLLTRAHPAAGGAPCDGDPSHIQLDLPAEDVYTCADDYISLPSQVLPSITSVYEQEIPSHVCTDTAIVYTTAIPNSGAHRHTWAKYGEYIYCPPQQWVHNLQHGGVAFLYHPCVHPKLKKALSSLARRYIAKHIITPLHTLSKDRPLALAAWCSTLEMSHINRTEIIGWLRDNVYIKKQYETGEEGSYQHLLIRPSVMPSGDSSMQLRVVDYVSKKGSRLRRRHVKRWRRFILPVTPVIQGTAFYNVSHSATSTAPAGPRNWEIDKNQTSVSGPSVAANISSSPDRITPGHSMYLPQEAETVVLKADIHSRELDGNEKVEMPEMLANNTSPTPENITPGLSGLILGHSVGENSPNDISHHADDKEELTKSAGIQPVGSSESEQSKVSVNTALFTTLPLQPQSKSAEQELSPSEKLLIDSKKKKPECRCQEDPTVQLPAKPQRRLGASQQKPSGVYIATPRTEEAKWAAASLILLFALLTFSVLYTQIYKKFRKSQSLYWTSGSPSEEESVASIIKRRLVQGHRIRKKWIGRKKSPVVLYESLSEDSEY